MIECPDCGREIHGKKCSCGYVVKFNSASGVQHSTQCAAHGCPLSGSMAGTTHASEGTSWFCRFHFNKKAEEWPAITQRVKSMLREELFPPLPYQPGRVEVKRLNFAKPGKDWAKEVLALQEVGQYSNDYGVMLAKAALRIQDKEAA